MTKRQRPPVYTYAETAPPGATIHKLREANDWSQRYLGERCEPPMDHTAIQRIERNKGYTRNSLERVAAALGVQVHTLFLPPELLPYASLPPEIKQRIAATIRDAATAYAVTKKD